MEWNSLLSEARLAEEKPEPEDFGKYPTNEFEKDYKKIISNSAFRRLQDKTQVFPLDKSDFVRTRLTHSIEVSTIAKQLGGMVKEGIHKFQPDTIYKIVDEDARKMSDILMCVGLLHDLGNPPFGHFGEVVIGDWFKNNLQNSNFTYKGNKITDILSDQMICDLENFEGNAQALRMLSKGKYNQNSSGINLTFGVLNTLVKYPTSSLLFNKDDINVKNHKFGFFFSEQELFKTISENTKTYRSESEFVRHPLTYILEAADDIAYATADLEDAFKKGLFSIDELVNFYDMQLEELSIKYSKKSYNQAKNLIDILRNALVIEQRSIETDLSAFNEWVNEARNWLMYVAAFRFTTNYSSIMEGQFKNDLFFDTFHELSIMALKNAMGKFVYSSIDILKLELSAQTIITFLLDKFIPAVIYYGEEDKENEQYNQKKSDKKFTDLISDNYKNDYKNAKTDDDGYNLYLRFLLVTDYISGMTDSFAKGLYQELNGIY